MYKPNYSISNNLLKYIGRIEACKEIITNAPLVPAWEARFREEAVVRSVHHGTHLEGNEVTKDQTENLMRLDVGQDEEAGEVAQEAGIYARHRDVQEVINYRSVLEWIDTHAADGRGFALFTEETLKKLHELVVDKLGPEDTSSTSVSPQNRR